MNLITTFPNKTEFEKAKNKLDELLLDYGLIVPSDSYAFVGVTAIVLVENAYNILHESGFDFVCSGWIDCAEINSTASGQRPPCYNEDIFGKAHIMFTANCTADTSRIRLIAHTEKDISSSFPYINAVRNDVSFNNEWQMLTFMDEYRMISLYPNRITVAKLDDIADGWRVLENIRRLVNETYADRNEIEPCYEKKVRPSVLEIFKRLPGISCRACGEMTCMAFASSVWSGNRLPIECTPIINGEFSHLKDAYLEICSGVVNMQLI